MSETYWVIGVLDKDGRVSWLHEDEFGVWFDKSINGAFRFGTRECAEKYTRLDGDGKGMLPDGAFVSEYVILNA